MGLKFVSILILQFLSFCALGQTLVDTLSKALLNYQQTFPQEKIYLHLDRPHYAPGDTIWVKAYVVEAGTHQLDSVSKNVYVDFLRTENGYPVRQLVLKNEGGFSHGYIKLPDTLSQGVYKIRAFTRWMRNFPDQYFFHKEIYVRTKYEFNDKYTEKEIGERLEIADLRFFPEGGNLIAGLQNRVAFKAINKFGLGIDFKGFIVSEHKDTVATIQSQHLGMGSFVFKPKAGEKYHVFVVKSSKTFELPDSQSSGYTFSVDNLSNPSQIKVIARNNYAFKERPVLIGHQRGNVVFTVQSKAEGNSFSWTLPKSDIKENGVVQLTLFSENGVPRCERIIYNHTVKPLQISIKSEKERYAPREQVHLSISVRDGEENPIQGNFSIAVTDSQQVNPDIMGSNICNYLNLTSDLQELKPGEIHGTVEHPDYYFDQTNHEAVVHLDILLMTQGWRRFLWSDVLNLKNVPQSYDIETGLSIRGNALLENGKKSATPIDVTLMYTAGNELPVVLKTKTDELGKFSFVNIEAATETKLFLQGVRKKRDHFVVISLDSLNFPAAAPMPGMIDPFFYKVDEFTVSLDHQTHLAELDEKLRLSNRKVLKEVIVTAKKEREIDSRKTMYDGTDMTSVAVTSQNCAGVLSVLQILQARVAGLEVVGTSATNYVAYVIRSGRRVIPAVLVDGMLTDMQFLNGLSPCIVESIDVITHPVTILNAMGLISILTKRANPNHDWSKEAAPGTLVTAMRGYDAPREFYSPKYLVPDSLSEARTPDFRSTLYWNPDIRTDAKGNAEVSFWNSDETTTVRVDLQGISWEGKPGVANHSYPIK